MRNAPRPARGFTLIELMLVITVIGLLSSIALPSFRRMQLRSKQTERNVMMTSIHRAIDEYWMRESRYPLVTAGSPISWMYLFYWNPDSTPGPAKRQWRRTPLNTLDHWNNLSVIVEGTVYYSYYGYAYEQPQFRYTYLQVKGDLDGDRVEDVLERYWEYQDNALLKYAGWSCNDCTYEIRTPANGLAF